MSLHATIVPIYLQTLGTVRGLIDKAEAFAAERGMAPADILQARLADDMLPFAYQIRSCASHSLGSVEGGRGGVFGPDLSPPPNSFDALRAKLDEAIAGLEALDADEVDAIASRDIRFEFGERRMPFEGADFFTDFSLPNFFFHASMAYAILRQLGVPLGKADWLSRMRVKQ